VWLALIASKETVSTSGVCAVLADMYGGVVVDVEQGRDMQRPKY